jgi:hypothetical protein
MTQGTSTVAWEHVEKATEAPLLASSHSVMLLALLPALLRRSRAPLASPLSRWRPPSMPRVRAGAGAGARVAAAARAESGDVDMEAAVNTDSASESASEDDA